MFKRILIANRGEIACRVSRTAKKLGIESIAVYSATDQHALHVKMADAAYPLSGETLKETYLNIEQLIAIAKQHQCEAIHPGYGFLSENVDFAAACEQAGIVFIGPSAAAISAMGLKDAGKTIMHKAGVPILPGYHEAAQDLDTLMQAAQNIGYPLLIKPIAGGGGKGMQVVNAQHELKEAIEKAQRQAKHSFGNDRLLLERYLDKPRHIEMQVLADQHGHGVYLFERDCSFQRRHQKVIEEAPAIHFSDMQREQMGECAIKAVHAINYTGVGTLEFLVNERGEFYFMEMNTRLQVEHPVTEMITGLDLVEWQLRVAAGEALVFKQDDLKIKGHAIEVRVYAEDPANQFLPSTGSLRVWQMPNTSKYVRVDSGVQALDNISVDYDPLLAKLIVHGNDRDSAIIRLKNALAEFNCVGVTTNVAFVSAMLQEDDYQTGAWHTRWLDVKQLEWLETCKQPIDPSYLQAVSVFAYLQQETTSTDPWIHLHNWQSIQPRAQRFDWSDAQEHPYTVYVDKMLLQQNENHLDTLKIYPHENTYTIHDVQYGKRFTLTAVNFPKPMYHTHHSGKGNLTATMPGRLLQWLVAPGDHVNASQALCILEAMKMEHTVRAPTQGLIKYLNYEAGELVQAGQALLEMEITEHENTTR